MVPAIMRRTFQLMAPAMFCSGRIPVTRKTAAAASTMPVRTFMYFMKIIMSTYMATNTSKAVSFIYLAFLNMNMKMKSMRTPAQMFSHIQKRQSSLARPYPARRMSRKASTDFVRVFCFSINSAMLKCSPFFSLFLL